MTMFSGENTVIAGGTFTHVTHNYPASSSSEGMKKLQGMIAHGAFHNSGERYDPPKCHPRTRLAVLKVIMNWVEVVEKTCFILWVYGPAGAGKSAIAQTIAEYYYGLRILAGSFFFSRTAPGRNDSGRLVATLAYQLVTMIPDMRSHVESALEHDPMVLTRSLEAQMGALIIGPLNHTFPKGRADLKAPDARLVIIDGLDECLDHGAQRYILKVIHATVGRLSVPLSFLVFSRPEQQIRDTFNTQGMSAITTSLVLDEFFEPDADIAIFLNSKFDDIKANHPFRSQIPPDWPPPIAIQRLVEKSSGQFIYASTVVKYVESTRHRPMQRLDVILGRTSRGRDTPFAELDNLYTLILDLVEQPDEVLKVLSFVILEQTSTVQKTVKLVEQLFEYESGYLYEILLDVHSILFVPPPDLDHRASKSLRLFHASFGDFLTDKHRSGKFHVDAGKAHALLTQALVKQLPTGRTLSIGMTPCQELSCEALGSHCLLSSPTVELMECLFNCNLQLFFRFHIDHGTLVDFLPALFSWFKKQIPLLRSYFPADASRHSLYNYHLSSWECCVLQSLECYPDPTYTRRLLAVLTTYIGRTNSIYSVNLHGSSGLVRFQYEKFYTHGLGLQGMVNHNPAVISADREYQDMLADFLMDGSRAGRYHVSGETYRDLVQHIIAYLEKCVPRSLAYSPMTELNIHRRSYAPNDSFPQIAQQKLESCTKSLPVFISKTPYSSEFALFLRLAAGRLLADGVLKGFSLQPRGLIHLRNSNVPFIFQ
ncbi:hypothetical protein B0H34DRAFT_716045 [Crassisporium funariophilum]|nr:hypothetical protein B0H34DRAFT_716045 [Crassisporium funariophilum]